MKQQQKIQLIENKIQELKSTLTLWNQEIKKYTLTLNNLNRQLKEIKSQIKEKK